VVYFWHMVANRFPDLVIEDVYKPESHRHADVLYGQSRSTREIDAN